MSAAEEGAGTPAPGAGRPEIVVCADPRTLVERAARRVAAAASLAAAARGRFAIALAGGSTPRPLYQRLAAPPAREAIDWRRTDVFWSDERCVPPLDARSNYRMAREAFLDAVEISPERIHRMRGEDPDRERAAADYEAVLWRELGEAPVRAPRLDLVLLGLGADGHTASLFPGSAAIGAEHLVASIPHAGDPPPPVDRLTLTPAALNGAREIVFLVSGPDKAEAVRGTLEGPRDPARWPAQAIAPAGGRVAWFVDRAAARGLTALAPGSA